MNMLKRDELNKRIYEYLKKYGNCYDEIESEAINELNMRLSKYIEYYYDSSYYHQQIEAPIFNQIFCAIEALPKEKNPYYQMKKIIEKEYGLDRNIIDVGSGLFPALSYEIAKTQLEIGKGTITAYDPNIIPKSLNGIKLVKKNFSIDTPIEEGSLIIGRLSCSATETIIRNANANKCELFILLCNCFNHEYPIQSNNNSEKNNSYINWELYIKNLIEQTIPKGFTLEEGELINPMTECTNTNTFFKTKRQSIKR